METTFVIVGGGLAGAKAVETLRSEGFDGRLVLVAAEDELPYERPPLSKELLRGEAERESTYVHPAEFYADNDVELLRGRTAETLDAKAASVTLDDGSELAYDALLIATGAEPRRLPVPGADLGGVHLLRTLTDCERLRERLRESGHAVVVGGGWIGCEVAASARQLGAEVTMLPGTELPLEHVLGQELGRFYRDVHTAHGVRILGGASVEAIEGDGRAERVRTTGGEQLDCDLVVMGVGVAPRAGLAESAGLRVENGIVADARLATSAPNVYAAGDVANHTHPRFGPLRTEHWHNALEQGPAAARNMLEEDEPYDEIPWFWSDQYEHNLQYAGFHTEWDELVVRGSLEERNFVAFYRKDGRVLAAVAVNRAKDLRRSIPLIKAQEPIGAAKLCDLDIDLRTLTGAAH
jgi:3-phenylpropionate/trans-cinnamate dioxygenase ferredoxin reductase component